jgi:hypothetical protein
MWSVVIGLLTTAQALRRLGGGDPKACLAIPFVRAQTNYKRSVELPKPVRRLHVAQLLQSRC